MAISDYIAAFARENKISEELTNQILAEAMLTAYKKKYGKQYENLEVSIDKKISMKQVKTVVESIEDEILEILAEDGLKYTRKKTLSPGDTVKIPVDISEFESRQIAQIVKQVLSQKISDIKKDLIYNEFKDKVGTVASGKVKSKTDSKYGGYYISIEPKGSEAFLPYMECVPDEQFDSNELIKFLILEVKEVSRKGETQIILSRRSEEFLTAILRMNIPEIADGTFHIRGIARKAGEVSKVVLDSNNPLLDPISVTVGKQGMRIKPIRSELGYERIEIIRWNEDPRQLITNAIRASRVLKNRLAEVFHIDFNMEEHVASVVVGDEFLAPLIGRGGSHQRMLEKILGWRIRFNPYSEFEVELKEKQKQVDEMLGIAGEEDEVQFVEDESIPITMLPFTETQIEVLQNAGFEDVAEIIEYSVDDLANKCKISLDNAVELWKVIEDSVEIEEEVE